MIYSKNLSIKYDVDIFVAGGGPAGFAAAVSAARQGKRVFLAENNGCFGGSGTSALVPSFAQFTDGKNFLVGGIGREVRDAVLGTECDYKRGFYPYSVEKLKRVYDDIAKKEANLSFSFFTKLVDVVSSDGRVEYVVLAAKSGMFGVRAKIYIDCTGDGDLCAWAGAKFYYGDENGDVMPSTLCSMWSNIDFSKDYINNRAPLEARLEDAINDGVFTKEDRHLPGILPVTDSVGGGNIGHVFNAHGIDETSLTESMIEGRKIMDEYKTFYSKYLEGYENMHLCYTGDMLGIRESRRIKGDYCLAGDDFKNRADFDDEIGRYAYPVDIHIMKPTKEAFDAYEQEYTEKMVYGVGESYGIPYRILLPEGLSNVLVAGRCVSTDRQMQASVRVMPGCYITGQAAGIAASLACDGEDTRKISVTELKNKIKKANNFKY